MLHSIKFKECHQLTQTRLFRLSSRILLFTGPYHPHRHRHCRRRGTELSTPAVISVVVARILVDGFPLRDLDIKSFRESIGYVGQEPRLFRMDVSSNIRYGCTREISHEEVEWAAKQAFAHEFILSLPNGYDSLVDNALLSGGQKQRIAIARAIVRDPTILILDEATSALDAESEHYVKGVLHAVRNGSKTKRTVIVIAHRLSTIQAADRIVVMDSGRIAEMGSHSELIQKDGLYSGLAKRQADAFA